jgi:hypothetical protein
VIADCQFPIFDWRLAIEPIGNRQSQIENPEIRPLPRLSENSPLSAPKARNVKAWAIGPGGTSLKSSNAEEAKYGWPFIVSAISNDTDVFRAFSACKNS